MQNPLPSRDDFTIEKVETIEESENAPGNVEQEIKDTEARLLLLKKQAAGENEQSNRYIPLAIVAAGIIIAGAIYVSNTGTKSSTGSAAITGPSGTNDLAPPTSLPPQGSTVAEVSADDDAFLGKESAPVIVIEFSDFQCPFCRRFWSDTLPQLKSTYIDTGKVKFVYRDFPLQFHQGAEPAAEGAECAEDQGKFWEMHDAIFEGQNAQGQGTIQFTKDDVKKWAAGAGLDMQKFNECLDSEKYKAEVAKDYADGTKAGVSGTPTLFINGRSVVGAQPLTSFSTIIDEELKKAGR